MKTLSNQAASGEIELAYLDEVGFSGVHPNRSAWTECGKCHLVEAKRCKRLNVLAAFLSSGKVLSAKYWENTTASVFVGFLHWIRHQVDKPLTVILDNASIHTAKSIAPWTAWLAKHGVTLYFCPLTAPNSTALSGCGTRSSTRGWPSSAERLKSWRPMWIGLFCDFRHSNF